MVLYWIMTLVTFLVGISILLPKLFESDRFKKESQGDKACMVIAGILSMGVIGLLWPLLYVILMATTFIKHDFFYNKRGGM